MVQENLMAWFGLVLLYYNLPFINQFWRYKKGKETWVFKRKNDIIITQFLTILSYNLVDIL